MTSFLRCESSSVRSGRAQSDPTNLDRETAVTPFNQTHTLSISAVLAPSTSGNGIGAMLLNNNQLGVILQANSGLPFNIRSNQDLNQDGVNNDRPLDIERNAGRLGRVLNLDLRYSRFIPFRDSLKGEVFFEAKNLFNTANIAGVNRVVTTSALGVPAATLLFSGREYPNAGKSGYDQRIMQLGLKFSF